MRKEYHVYTDTGGRSENEDSVGVRQYGDNLVVVVADGLGGQGDGRAASQLVCESLLGCGADGMFPTVQAVEAAFDRANRELLAAQKNAFHMKTTAVYFCLNGDRAIWAHTGDSRLYHIHDGELKDYTLDHSASQLAVFLGSITRADIPCDPGRSRLIRAMGIEGETADVHEAITLEPKGQHMFLLCSDGLWEYLTDEEIVRCSACAESVKGFLEALWKLKISRSGTDCDNNTGAAILADWRCES